MFWLMNIWEIQEVDCGTEASGLRMHCAKNTGAAGDFIIIAPSSELDEKDHHYKFINQRI